MNDLEVRDLFAMFAMAGILSSGEQGHLNPALKHSQITSDAYTYADAMLDARKPKEELGIAAVTKRRAK